MKDAPGPDRPDELKPSVWDRKKGSLPRGQGVGDELGAIQKNHDAVDGMLLAAWAVAAPASH